MFPTRTLVKLLAILEELGVNHFVVGNFHVWPALKFLLAQHLQDNDQTKERAAYIIEAERKIEQLFEQLMITRGPQPDVPPAQLLSARAHVHAKHSGGLLLVSRGEDHYVRTGESFYAPVIDPWATLAQGRWPFVKLELASQKFRGTYPRHVMTLAAVNMVSSHDNKEDLAVRDSIVMMGRALSAIVRQWLEAELKISLSNLSELFDAELASQWHDKQVYRELIQAIRPRFVITTCYYYRPTLGAVWAARELGVPVADMQHGGNGESHIGYTHWRHVPASGYHLLPDYFLVWDNISANNILRWLPPGATAHQPLIAGRFGLGHANNVVLTDGRSSPISALTYGSEKNILVTLQTLGSTGLSPLILETMRKAPPTWTWLVRGHPMAQTWGDADLKPEGLEAKMKEAGITRYDARLTTSLPLASILPHVHHHLTGFSGTVQECAAYGIRTTFTHPTVWSFFGHFIAMGVADLVDTADTAVQSIAAAKPFPDISHKLVMPRDDATAMGVLSQIMDGP